MMMRLWIVSILLCFAAEGKTIVIQKVSQMNAEAPLHSEEKKSLAIAVISSPKLIGKYAQSVYNVSLATLLSFHNERFSIRRYDMEDESPASLSKTLEQLRQDKIDAVLAPLTKPGADNLLRIDTKLPIFIPTVHKRDLSDAPENIVFGGIDYRAQIEALVPYMADTISIFYDSSAVGSQLNASTEEVFLEHKSEKKKVRSYAVDTEGDNIVSHLAKPSLFAKISIIIHIPVVKSAILASQLTFRGIKERNILSTQVNVDPNLLFLTQMVDRKNMILANSLIEFPSTIYQMNELMNNDLSYDWIQYASSVGIDYLVSVTDNRPRTYTMRLVNSQIIYPVELLRTDEYGFEPLYAK